MNRPLAGCIVVFGLSVGMVACSGGGGSSPNTSPQPPPSPPPPPPPPPPTSGMGAQIQAAIDTANNSDPTSTCGTIDQNLKGSNDGFYWEIGDENGIISDSTSGLVAAGSVQPSGADGDTYTRTTKLSIASASKWIYGAYIAETQAVPSGGSWVMPPSYVPFLHFTSGYENMNDDTCPSNTGTVLDCLDTPNDPKNSGAPDNGSQTAADAGKFFYNSGHLEVFEGGADSTIAGVMNGAGFDGKDLGDAVQSALAAHNVNINITYTAANPAGGIATTAGDYAAYLQGLIRKNDPLIMHYFLKPTDSDADSVCTNPYDKTCVDQDSKPLAIFAPLPPNVSWHYSITHWIEDDATTGVGAGDGSYSSPGKLGFYPWVDKTFTYYGIVAREDHNQPQFPQNAPFFLSDQCGEAIRTAFLTGTKQN